MRPYTAAYRPAAVYLQTLTGTGSALRFNFAAPLVGDFALAYWAANGIFHLSGKTDPAQYVGRYVRNSPYFK